MRLDLHGLRGDLPGRGQAHLVCPGGDFGRRLGPLVEDGLWYEGGLQDAHVPDESVYACLRLQRFVLVLLLLIPVGLFGEVLRLGRLLARKRPDHSVAVEELELDRLLLGRLLLEPIVHDDAGGDVLAHMAGPLFPPLLFGVPPHPTRGRKTATPPPRDALPPLASGRPSAPSGGEETGTPPSGRRSRSTAGRE